MKRILMVAYHFPPFAGSSGVQRTLRFVQHLPAFGWEPVVLTVRPAAYERTSDELNSEVSAGVHVERAFALDTAQHLTVGGRYPAFLARPDRWMSWRFAGVAAGMRLIRHYGAQVIWSTYPIATAHVIGRVLHQRSGLPWIADFRDPMAQEGYPPNPRLWRSFKAIEEKAVRNARFSVFTTPGAARDYKQRYPDAADRINVIENGFDEESFAGLPGTDAERSPLLPGALTLLHSGLVYPSERDPTMLFAALKRLSESGRIRQGKFKLRFRAAGHEELLANLARENNLRDFVEILPPIAYRPALEEMTRADGLLVLQAANCNEQIPAKLYEYLRSGRPILALTDSRGDTAATIRQAGLDTIASLDSIEEIQRLVERFIDRAASRTLSVPDADFVATASRKGRAGLLATLLEHSMASN